MKNKTILVIGGCGNKMHDITNSLVEDNKVIVIDKLSTGDIYSVDNAVTVYEDDIRNTKRVNDVLKEHKIDYILDLITAKYKLNTYR